MKTGHGDKQSRLQEAAIAALLSTRTIGEAARNVGINEETLARWLRDPSFSEEYRRARRDLMSQVSAQLQRAATQAVAALSEIVADSEAGASARVSAARTILEMSARNAEIEDIDARLSALERAAAEKDGAKTSSGAVRLGYGQQLQQLSKTS